MAKVYNNEQDQAAFNMEHYLALGSYAVAPLHTPVNPAENGDGSVKWYRVQVKKKPFSWNIFSQ